MTELEALRERFKRYIKWSLVDNVVLGGNASNWSATCNACGQSVPMSTYEQHPCFLDYWQAEETEIAAITNKEMSMLGTHINALRDFYQAWEAMRPSIMVYMLGAPADIQERMKEFYKRSDEVRASGARDWLVRWSVEGVTKCPDCNGTGREGGVSGYGGKVCPTCDGKGQS